MHRRVTPAARSTEAQASVDADASEAGCHGHSQGPQESPPTRRGKENAGVSRGHLTGTPGSHAQLQPSAGASRAEAGEAVSPGGHDGDGVFLPPRLCARQVPHLDTLAGGAGRSEGASPPHEPRPRSNLQIWGSRLGASTARARGRSPGQGSARHPIRSLCRAHTWTRGGPCSWNGPGGPAEQHPSARDWRLRCGGRGHACNHVSSEPRVQGMHCERLTLPEPQRQVPCVCAVPMDARPRGGRSEDGSARKLGAVFIEI